MRIYPHKCGVYEESLMKKGPCYYGAYSSVSVVAK